MQTTRIQTNTTHIGHSHSIVLLPLWNVHQILIKPLKEVSLGLNPNKIDISLKNKANIM